MKLPCDNSDSALEFEYIELIFKDIEYKDVFKDKNNKTVFETLDHPKYAKLSKKTNSMYHNFISWPLGNFLIYLKENGDNFYNCFLNKYGDLTYSSFKIIDIKYLNSKGIYFYLSGTKLMYIGRCIDSMKKRVNQGYGKIQPKNCYLDGQRTNCHINANITKCKNNISLWFSPMVSNAKIKLIERQLIVQCSPSWNTQ